MSDLVDEIKSHRLSEVVGKFANLKNEGANRKKCCCPFHREKTPSFHLDDKKGTYHCFGCGAGGDIIKFIEEIKKCNFQQAIDYLCDIFFIDKNKYKKYKPNNYDENNLFYKTMDTISNYYQECLYNNKEALDYIKTIRCINDETEKEFLFGFADDNLENLLNYCKKNNIEEDLLLKYNIIRESQNTNGKKYKYLFFRNRIMIPIHNKQGKIVAFGGRTYKQGDDSAKYLNSSESDFFKKGDILFNFNRARKNLDRDKTPLIIVEGYMDAIALWQNGFKTAVAPLGTSITEKHLKDIFYYCNDPIFLFDNDSAGQRATIRACEMMFSMLKTGIVPRICKLNGAKDVDEFLKKNDKEQLKKQFVNNSKEINQFIIDINKQNINLNDPNNLSKIKENIYSLTDKIKDKNLKESYEKFFKSEINTIIYEKKYKKKSSVQKINISNMATAKINIDYIEKKIISYLLKYDDLQKDYEINENIISLLTSDSKKLLQELNNKSNDQKQEFYDRYIEENTDIDKKNILINLSLSIELEKIKNSNLHKDIKESEIKKILAKKKSLIKILS